MKVPAGLSSQRYKYSLTLALLLGLAAVMGISGCSSSSTSDPTVTITDASVSEGDSGTTDLVFTITASKSSKSVITITYATSGGTATAGTDYTETSGTIDIPAGSTSVTVTVPITADTDIEDDETLTLTLSAASGATLGTAIVTGTILNDDHADPSGYYNSGSATIKDPANAANDLVLSDLKAMVNGNRMLIMSQSTAIVYDATITAVTMNDFTADVTLYYGMDGPYNVATPAPITTTMSGTITEASQISGTIAGTGIGTGNLTLSYSLTNSNAADMTNVVGSWVGSINTLPQVAFDFQIVSTAGEIDVDVFDTPDKGIFESCQMTGSISPIANSTLYTLNVSFTTSTCAKTSYAGDYTGLATTTDSNNDTLVTTFSNGTVSFTAELNKL
jgi:hypothetical protein